MNITYNYEENSWVCKWKVHDGKGIYICATQWDDTKKGPLINFAVLVGSLEESDNFFFEVEIFTKKTLQAKQFAEYCKQIISCYTTKGTVPFSSVIIRCTGRMFKKCNVDAYYRTIGRNPKMLLYAGIRHKLFRTVRFWHEANKESQKNWPKPALEYPISRFDSID